MAWNGGGRGGGRSGGRGGSPSSGRERDDGGGRGGGRGGQGGRGQGRGQGGRGGTPPQSVPRSTPPPAPVTRATPSSTPVWGAPPPASARAAEQQLAEVFEEKATIESVPRSAPSQGQVGKYSMPLAHRGSGGTAGTPVVLLANHFRVKYTPTDDIYRYDVELRGEGGKKLGNANGIPSKPLAEKLMNALIIRLRGQFPQSNVVSDYRKNVYAPIRLPFEGELLVNALDIGERRGVNQEPSLFQAILKPVEPEAVRMEQLTEFMNGRLNYTPQDAIQALDVVLRHLGAQRMTMVGRNFFSGDGATPLGGGAEAWSGYFQSLRPTQNGLIVNLDVSSTAFVRAMPALEFVAEVCATYNNNAIPQSVTPSQYKVVHKTVRGIKVETTHLRGQRRSYRVNGLSPKSASETFFEDENGRRISVVQYFQQHYQRRLQYPNLPCLHVGAMEKKTYLPIEVCHIQAGTKVPRKLTEDQTANMIRVTATRPDVRRQRIDQHVRDAQFVGDSTLGAFGMSVDPKMVQVQGRVLPAPSIVYARNQMEKPRDGVWTSRNKQYFTPQKLVSCAIINTDFKLDDRAIRTFFKELFSEANKLGMGQIATMPPIITQRRGDRIGNLFYQAMQAALDTFKGVKPQIIWMINPRQNADTYGALKIASDTEYGIPSQCMLSKHIMKVNGQYIGNILLKVNTKLGGCNSTLQPSAFPMQIGSKKTIIFGADVTHASPGDTRPSIAALVGSLNKDFTRHASVIRLQGHREEKMVHLSEMVKELMKAFYKDTNGHKPDQIVFFRDGVSEGQFEMVLNEEVTAIRAACASLDKDFKPPITFVIVQKRHHTRFFGTKPNDVDRSGNVRAGTVVDTAVCHPIENDFYLTSHAGLQGTSRPTHYQVLMDEIGLSSDDIQKLTNNLCYTYARCTRSVSLVPSTYYSHLLAFRARFFMSDEFSDTGSSANGYGATPTMPQVHANLLRTMYYI